MTLPRIPRIALLLVAAAGCNSPSAAPGADAAVDLQSDVRGSRYCEVLVGKVAGNEVLVDVYNTWGLNDCPAAQWAQLDAARIKADFGAAAVVLNGPRYWLVDSFAGSMLLDPTPQLIDGLLEMRKAGVLHLSLADVANGVQPYVALSVQRDTTWVFQAGKSVYELVDPAGKIYDMQSFSVQKVAQTEASLSGLGASLALPAGWSFRSRVVDAELQVVAVGGLATIVQDDNGNTYQLSQQ
jgi:hypothetical protein